MMYQIFIPDTNISSLLHPQVNPAPKLAGIKDLGGLLTQGGFSLINIIFIFVGLAFFANLVIAGWEFMMSTGDVKKTTAASTRISNGLIGLLMAVAAFIIVKLISQVLGLSGSTATPVI